MIEERERESREVLVSFDILQPERLKEGGP